MAFDLDRQREVTGIALQACAGAGFALAGGGALREHGVTDRPTEDIDLFTVKSKLGMFADAVVSIGNALKKHDFTVATRSGASDGFARLNVTAPGAPAIEMDIGIDYRSKEPEQLDIGPVIALDDSVGGKVSTAFSRGLPRDFLDLDSIRQSARYTDAELLRLAAHFDAGFDPAWLAKGIDHMVAAYPGARFSLYGVSGDDLAQVRKRLARFAGWLRDQ